MGDNLPSQTATDAARREAPLTGRVIRGSAWTFVGYVSGQGIRLAGNLVLTRLLFPEAFGLMSLVQVFMQGLQMFSDVGIGPSLIQNKRGDDPHFVNTAWTIQVIRGCTLSGIAAIIAWPVAAFYGEPTLGWLLTVSGLTAMISGFTSSAVFMAQRHLALGRLTLLDLGSQIIGTVLMVTLAISYRSVWVLVVGGLVSAITRTVLSHMVLASERNRLRWERSSVSALLTFGKWIFVSTLTTFLAGQADRLIFGKMIPLEMLGVYSIAAMLATMPAQLIVKIGSAVIFPAYSRIVQAGESLRSAMTKVRKTLMLGGGALVAFMAATGSALVSVLYDERYADAGLMLQILSIGTWFQILQCTNGSALLALGNARWVAAGNLAKLIGLAILVPLGFLAGGFTGALVALVVTDAMKYLTSAIGTSKSGLGGLNSDLVLTICAAATSGGLILIGKWMRQLGNNEWMVLLVAALCACVLTAIPAARMAHAQKVSQ